jgi:hypothetical protein
MASAAPDATVSGLDYPLTVMAGAAPATTIVTLVARSSPQSPAGAAKYRNSYTPLVVGAVVVNDALVDGAVGGVCEPFIYHQAEPFAAPAEKNPIQSYKLPAPLDTDTVNVDPGAAVMEPLVTPLTVTVCAVARLVPSSNAPITDGIRLKD